MVVDLHGLCDQALVDVHGLKVLDVTQSFRERQAGNVALGLSGNVEIGSGLESFTRAGNLGVADRRGKQTAYNGHPLKARTIHRSPPPRVAAADSVRTTDQGTPINSRPTRSKPPRGSIVARLKYNRES
jgi:hypothetical protein